VNAVYSKMPVEQGFMQSRDAKNVSTIEDRCSGTSKVNQLYSKTPVEKGCMQSRDATVDLVYVVSNAIRESIDAQMQSRTQMDGFVNETRYEYRVSKRIGVSKGS
jgi:hypothetical protein